MIRLMVPGSSCPASAVEPIGAALLARGIYNLGNLCQDLGRADEAVTHFQRAAALKPDSVEILNNLGTALHDQGSLDTAVACYQKALSLRPDAIETLANYAGALRDEASWAGLSSNTSAPSRCGRTTSTQ